MKVCKKCKKQVANKSKICKYCGADVSKAKIISKPRSNSSTPKKNNYKKINKPIINETKEEAKTVEKELEQEEVKEELEQIKEKETKINLLKNKVNSKLSSLKEKIARRLKKLKTKKTEEEKRILKLKRKERTIKLKEKLRSILEKIKERFINLKVDSKIKRTARKNKRARKKDKKKDQKEIKNKEKEEKKQEKEKQKELKLKKKEEKWAEKADKWEAKQKVKEEKRKQKEKEELPNIIQAKEQDLREKTLKIIEDKKDKVVNSKVGKNKKVQILAKIVIILGLMCLVAGVSLYFLKTNTTTEVALIKGEEATNNKIFSVGDIINYKGVSYKIANVRTSEGNSYSVPRDGNIYLIVTIYIINNTEHRIDYSYNSWVLTDKKNRKVKQVFSSINVEDALYSGKLNKGVTKRGSIIFEESKKAEQMRLNFYPVEINQDKEETIDYNKKVFSVNIEMPKDVNKKTK